MPEKLPTSSIRGLEIFSSGKWNSDVYTDADLDSMVSAFGRVGFEPPIKAGHADGQENPRNAKRLFGEPALGYVERIYRKGSKLLADVKDIPAKFAQLIRAGTYRRISSEIYWNYRSGEQTFPRVLKAVSFLGSDIPSLTNLKAIESLFGNSNVRVVTYANVKFDSERSYGMENSDFGELLARYNQRDPEAEAEVDQLVKQRMSETGKEYSTCLYSLRDEARTKRYSGDGPIGRPKEDLPKRYQSGVELDRRAKELALARGLGYTQALRIAMLEDPTAAKEYGYSVSNEYASKMPMSQLSNICSAFTDDNGMMNWVDALDAALAEPEVVQRAATSRIEELCDRLISVEGVPGSVVNQPGTDYRGECRRRIRIEYPNLAKASVDGSALNEEGLRQILWTKK